jgi:hypothetical protein
MNQPYTNTYERTDVHNISFVRYFNSNHDKPTNGLDCNRNELLRTKSQSTIYILIYNTVTHYLS